jgi:hypothetical protein
VVDSYFRGKGLQDTLPLLGQQATRDQVISQFQKLLTNAAIKAGDIVLSYFSGHGSYARSNPAPARLSAE